MQVPLPVEAMLPSKKLSICDFLSTQTPGIQAASIQHSPMDWFSRNSPTTDLERVLKNSIPPTRFVADLKKHVEHALSEGMQSVLDKRTGDLLPLTSIALWDNLIVIAEGRRWWRQSEAWLDKIMVRKAYVQLQPSEQESIQEAQNYLSCLPWNDPVSALGASTRETTTLKLSRILNDAMLTDDLIDMMVQHIAFRLRKIGRAHV